RSFPAERTDRQLAWSAWAFAASVVVSFVVYLQIPTFLLRLVAVPYVSLAYVVSAIPFTASGVCVCLALTRFPRDVGRLYAADLLGAAVGCLALIVTLKMTDGPTAVLVVAAVAASGATAFATRGGRRLLALTAASATV